MLSLALCTIYIMPLFWALHTSSLIFGGIAVLTLGSLNDVSNSKVTLASEPLYARLFTLPSYFYPVNLLDQILQLILLSTDCTFYLAQF